MMMRRLSFPGLIQRNHFLVEADFTVLKESGGGTVNFGNNQGPDLFHDSMLTESSRTTVLLPLDISTQLNGPGYTVHTLVNSTGGLMTVMVPGTKYHSGFSFTINDPQNLKGWTVHEQNGDTGASLILQTDDAYQFVPGQVVSLSVWFDGDNKFNLAFLVDQITQWRSAPFVATTAPAISWVGQSGTGMFLNTARSITSTIWITQGLFALSFPEPAPIP